MGTETCIIGIYRPFQLQPFAAPNFVMRRYIPMRFCSARSMRMNIRGNRRWHSVTGAGVEDGIDSKDSKDTFAVPPDVGIGEALSLSEQFLVAAGDPEATDAAPHLVASATGKLRGPSAVSELRRLVAGISGVEDASKEGGIGPEMARRLDALLRRRGLCREPVQYLVGEWDFHCLENLALKPPVLIPRPETEELVELALAEAKLRLQMGEWGGLDRPLRILDIGAGTGAIGLAILKSLQGNDYTGTGTPAVVVALEPNSVAAALATHNAAAQGVSSHYRCFHGSLASFRSEMERADPDTPGDSLLDCLVCGGGDGFDLIVSNPPYIPAKDMETLMPEVKEYEDFGALCGGEDGLDVVREIVDAAPSLLRRQTDTHDEMLRPSIFLEVDPTHPRILEDWLRPRRIALNTKGEGSNIDHTTAEPLQQREVTWLESHEDLAGKARFCVMGVA